MRLTIAVLQMDCREGARAENRDTVRRAAEQAKERGAALIALPELWQTGYDLERSTAEREGDDAFAWLAGLARRLDISILGGSLLEWGASGVSNCAVACDAGGERARYRKAHLFKPLEEHRYLHAGERPPAPFELAGARCAIAICYDLRFAELFRPLALGGVELIHVPAQWPRARIHHWRTLLVARAIETQSYVVGVNRLGRLGRLEFPGNSLVVAPTGDVLLDAGETPGLSFAEFDGEHVGRLRAAFPVLEDRRTDLFPDAR